MAKSALITATGRFILHFGDILDSFFLTSLLSSIQIDELYHLAAQSHVGVSFSLAQYSSDVNALGTLRILQAMLATGKHRNLKFYNACSSEVFGKVLERPQNENTPFQPLSPYATAKAFGYWTTINMRHGYGLFASNGILFNHESPRRGLGFVTRKISYGVAAIRHGRSQTLLLGNLESRRDWGHARDYAEGIYQIMQLPEAADVILATGVTHSVREFAEEVFLLAGIPIHWEGQGVNEVGKQNDGGQVRIRIDPQLYRPNEVEYLCGSPKKAQNLLGWYSKTSFKALVKEMFDADMELFNSMAKTKVRDNLGQAKL
ncbi:hypothetical protein OPT61_g6555 [Boeremia exigua]|uniref:Uncharacterized protein n=1 Tax=Boeremia exigua TaxID=749465 RepID=A0ACC2I5M0_9PLEO|nr:hypothetical protein OPT61_g6555 [Boeremia exigua]